MLDRIISRFYSFKMPNFLLAGEEGRLLILLKNLALFSKKKIKPYAIENIKNSKKYFIPVKIPQIESLCDPNIIVNAELKRLVKSDSNIHLLYDLSTESITFANYPSKVLREFHELIATHDFPYERVHLICANSVAKQNYLSWASENHISKRINMIGYHFYLYEYLWEVLNCKSFESGKVFIDCSKKTVKQDIKRPYHFLCLNLRPRAHRTAIVLHLMERGFFNKGHVTYFGEQFGHHDHESVDSLNSSIQYLKQLSGHERLLALFDKLQTMAPIQWDKNPDQMRKDLWHRSPGQVEFLIPESTAFEKTGIDSYFEIVTETWFTDNTNLYLTEKTVRPIVRLQPFIFVGPPFILKTLRGLGFKTFSPWIDETYDEIVDPVARMEKIFEVIDQMCSMSIDEIHKIYCELWPVLLHNHKHFFKKLKRLAREDIYKNIFENISDDNQVVC